MHFPTSSPAIVLALALSAHACQRDLDVPRTKPRHVPVTKRQATAPPVLSEHEALLVNSFDNTSISDWSYYYTHGAHVAGTNKSQAQWTADRWSENGIPSHLAEYSVYLNYPVSHSLSLTYPNGSVWNASLQEEVLQADETTSYPNRIPTFHGYSATGKVTAEYVYVGRGQQVDFKRLLDLGVPLEGKIALAKYGGPFRGLKVKNAQEHGMIGAIIFTDPSEDGNVTEANGYAAYPDGPARNPTSVQRGSVQFLSTYPGDPTTPGYPSHPDSPRADKSSVVPKIPSIPISYLEAIPLLEALDGHGTPGNVVNRTGWVGALNVTYSTGPAPGAVLSLENVMRDAITPIWDAIGIINGTNPDETVVVGNHRDAWIVGGAADPNSGSAIVVELSRALGKLLKQGWKPRRNIVLASWDAEEYGLVGSTEWVEEFIDPWLTNTAVSYINIDVGTSGPNPDFAASPELHSIATEVMKKVYFPKGGSSDQILYDIWYDSTEGEVEVLGSGSDYTAFLHKGIGSIDLGAGARNGDPIYHYHSNFDSYHWMSTYGDPGFHVHKAMGQFLTLLLYHVADDPVLPLDIPNFGTQIQLYYSELLDTINSTIARANTSRTLNTTSLLTAINQFSTHAQEFASLESLALRGNNTELVSVVNHKKRDVQRAFVSQGGLPNREFYKHVLFAPGIDTGYAPVTFPGITEALEAGNWTLAQEWVGKTARAIELAGQIIKT